MVGKVVPGPIRRDIQAAIHRRQRLHIRYGGGMRVIEPYAFGAYETHELLRAYQVSGYSPSRERGWKLFRAEEIEELPPIDERFDTPKDGYMRNDPCMEVIYAEI